jgi:ABC-type sugar transport system ATPase subunit
VTEQHKKGQSAAPAGPAAGGQQGPPAARFESVSKRFGAVQALRDIDLTLRPGTVHAFVGENGAGKSTALGILAGRLSPSSGRVEVFGEEFRYGHPRAARRLGVVAIYQELTVLPELSPEANVFLGQTPTRGGVLSEREMRRRYTELCEQMNVVCHPRGTRSGTLSVADQQILEIMRALISDARILLFDEPTAALATPEREALFTRINGLRERGITIGFVSHNLDEVLDLSDDISVFRDGQLKASSPRADWTKAGLVETMLGREADRRILAELLEKPAEDVGAPAYERPARLRDDELLRVEEVTVKGAIEDVSLTVRRGELAGLGGLVGSGRSTLLRALAGAEQVSSGRIWIEGVEVPWPRSIRASRRLGIFMLPEDRKAAGLVPAMTSMENILLCDLPAAARAGVVSPRGMEKRAASIAAGFGFSAARLRTPASHLSGGNQQKLLLARARHAEPKLLLADEPTRGVDIGAKEEIMDSLDEMAGDGIGIAIVSSELEEVAAVCDRVTVLAEGHVAGHLDRAKGEITVSDILHLAFELEGTAP